MAAEAQRRSRPRPPRSSPTKLAAGETTSVEITQAHLDRIAAVDGDIHAFLHLNETRARDRRGRRRAAQDGRQARPARRRSDRDQGCAVHARHAEHRRLAHPRGLGSALRRDRRRPSARSRPRSARQDQHGRVRHGFVDRVLGFRPDPQPVGPRPHPGRFRAAVPPRPSPRSRRPSRSVPTPAARSASPRRHRLRRREAHLRRRLPLRRHRAGELASTRSARSRAPCSTPRCCTTSSAATTRATPPA